MPARVKTPVQGVPPTVIGPMMWEMAPAFQLLTLPTEPACHDAESDHGRPVRGEVKQPIGPHARDASRPARQAQTAGTAPASDEVEPVRRAACNPQLWGAWAFETGPAGRSLGYHWMGVTGPP